MSDFTTLTIAQVRDPIKIIRPGLPIERLIYERIKEMNKKNDGYGNAPTGLMLSREESIALAEKLAQYPDRPTNYYGFHGYESERHHKAAERFPHMQPLEYWTKYGDLNPGEAIKFFESKNLPVPENILQGKAPDDETEDSPEETGFTPDLSADPANAWEETKQPDPENLQPDGDDDLPF